MECLWINQVLNEYHLVQERTILYQLYPLAYNLDSYRNRLYFLLVRILRTLIQNPRISEKLGILPIDCLDYRLVASLVELIGDQSTQICENAIKMERNKISKKLSQKLLDIHRIAHESHENAMRALFTHDISLAESIKRKESTVANNLHEIETLVRIEQSEFAFE